MKENILVKLVLLLGQLIWGFLLSRAEFGPQILSQYYNQYQLDHFLSSKDILPLVSWLHGRVKKEIEER